MKSTLEELFSEETNSSSSNAVSGPELLAALQQAMENLSRTRSNVRTGVPIGPNDLNILSNDPTRRPAMGDATQIQALAPNQMTFLRQNFGGISQSIPQSQETSVSHLLASLSSQHVQQQVQRQAQVQAAIARVFGPSAEGWHSANSLHDVHPIMQLTPASTHCFGSTPSLKQFSQRDPTVAGTTDLLKLHLEQEYRNRMMNGNQWNNLNTVIIPNKDEPNKKTNIGDVNNPCSPAVVTHANSTPSVSSRSNAMSPNTMVSNNDEILPHALSKGTIIIPCRARGMTADHSFKTAYFVIRDGISHGDELFCSFPACRQAGIKFRYCLYCKVPVAKRNFRNRHRHGLTDDDDSTSSCGGAEEECSEVDNDEKRESYKTTEGVLNETNSVKSNHDADLCLPTENSENTDHERENIIILPMKTSKKKRVPCRSRGMPMTHNFKTAYFVIPPDVQHGDELICSFPSCCAAGAKFRYCLHCKIPVAKRNFCNRHKHNNSAEFDRRKNTSNQDNPEISHSADKEENMKTDELPDEDICLEDMKEKKLEECTDDAKLPPITVEAEVTMHPPLSQVSEPIHSINPINTCANTTVAVSSSHNPETVQQWVSLLEKKPTSMDKQAMAIWMLNLMNTIETTINDPSKSSSTAGSSKENESKFKSEKDHENLNVSYTNDPCYPLKDNPSTLENNSIGEHPSNLLLPQSTVQVNFENDPGSEEESNTSHSRKPPKKKFKQDWEGE